MRRYEADSSSFSPIPTKKLQLYQIGAVLNENQEIQKIIASLVEVPEIDFDKPDYVFFHIIPKPPPVNSLEDLKTVVNRASQEDHNYPCELPCRPKQDLAYFCNICAKNWKDSIKFNQHFLAMHVKKNEVVCEMCETNLLASGCLQDHLQKVHTIICEVCGALVPTAQLEYHQNKKNGAGKVGNYSRKNLNQGADRYCEKTLDNEAIFVDHVENHKNQKKKNDQHNDNCSLIDVNYLNSCLNEICPVLN